MLLERRLTESTVPPFHRSTVPSAPSRRTSATPPTPTSNGISADRNRGRGPEARRSFRLIGNLSTEERRVEHGAERSRGLTAPLRLKSKQHRMTAIVFYVERGGESLKELLTAQE